MGVLFYMTEQDTIELIKAASLPVCRLIEAVENAIGKAYEPRYIKKMANARAYEIKVISEELRNNIDIPIEYNGTEVIISSSDDDSILKRASSRLAYQELCKQENIESVIGNAIEELKGKEVVSEEKVDKDWMLRFINSVEDISNEDMQKLWAKILVGEVVNPNSFSLRTLEVLRSINQNEAELFSKLCDFVLNNSYVYNNNEIIQKYGITYRDILRLDECGLINSNSMLQLNIKLSEIPKIAIDYDKFILLSDSSNDITLQIPQYPLTEAGKNLYKIANGQISFDYLVEISRELRKKNPSCNFTLNKVMDRKGNVVQYEKEPSPF